MHIDLPSTQYYPQKHGACRLVQEIKQVGNVGRHVVYVEHATRFTWRVVRRRFTALMTS